MAEVFLQIGNRQHRIACKDGSEEQVRRMGAMIDSRWGAASRASGGKNDERSMLFVALMLADALDETARATAPAPPPPTDDSALTRIAERIEAIAAALENSVPKP